MISGVEVAAIGQETSCVTITTTTGDEYGGCAAIVATGSRYRRLGIPGEEGLTGLGVHYCATCDGPFYRGAKELVVIGGGNSALEESLFLTNLAEHVTILTHGDLRASELVQAKVLGHPKIKVRTNVEIEAFEAADGRLRAVAARGSKGGDDKAADKADDAGGAGGETIRIEAAAAFVFVGLDPNTAFLRGSVDLDERGFVRTDSIYRTSFDGVFAAGDVRSGSTKQVGSAAGEGIAALLSVRRWLEEHHLKAPATVE